MKHIDQLPTKFKNHGNDYLPNIRFLLSAMFITVLMSIPAQSYVSPNGTVTLKCVSWTDITDTTTITASLNFRVYASGGTSLNISEFSSHFRQIFLVTTAYSELPVGWVPINLGQSMLRWEDFTSCGCDGDFYYDVIDTLNHSISGSFIFEPACYFAPPFRLVIGEFTIGTQKPSLTVYPSQPSVALPKDSLHYRLNVTINDTINIAGANVYVDDPFDNLSFKLIGTTDEEGNSFYSTYVPEDIEPNNYHISFYAKSDTLPATDTVSVLITIELGPTLSMSVMPSEQQIVSPADTIIYQILIKDEEDELVSQANIYAVNPLVSQQKTLIGQTDANGEFTYEVIIPEDKTPEIISLKFSAEKDDFPPSSEITRNIEITEPKIKLIVVPSSTITTIPGDSVSFYCRTLDHKNEPIVGAQLYFRDTLSTALHFWQLVATDDEGRFKHSFKVPDDAEGFYQFEFFALHDGFLASDTLTRSVIVEAETQCWEYLDGILVFCIDGSDNWKPVDDEPKIQTDKRIIINDFMIFEGVMTLDTANLGINANGKFFLQDIPLPGGGIGTFTVAEGEYDLTFGGEDGMITNFINSKMQKVAGFEILFTDLQLIGGRNAEGIKLGASMKVPGLAVGCNGSGDDKKTEFAISDLEIKRSGISIGGFKVENLGFYSFPNFCINELHGGYDSDADKLAFGAHVKIPFGEVGGGLAFIGGELDSVGFRVEASYPPLFVIGTTTVGIVGFFGHISGITQPQLEFELGGILSDIAIEDLYKIDMSGIFRTPGYIGIKGDGSFIKDPLTTKWQLKAELEGGIDFPVGLMELKGAFKVGTKDEVDYLITADASLKYNMYQSKFAGKFDGEINLPEFDSGWPYDWLNSTIGLPKTASTSARFIYGKSKLIWGDAYFGRTIGNLSFVLDLNQSWDNDDFFFFERTEEQKKIVRDKSDFVQNAKYRENFVITNNTERFVIRISTVGNAVPDSELQAPNGTTYKQTAADSSVVLSHSADNKKAFWTLVEPEDGEWVLSIDEEMNDYEIDTYSFDYRLDFTVNSNLMVGKIVNVTWATAGMAAGDSIDIFLDDDNIGENGLFMTTVAAMNGSAEIRLTDSLQYCDYYVYAVFRSENYAIVSYAPNPIFNLKTSLIHPMELAATYYTSTERCVVEWEAATEPNVVGYAIYAVDSQGNEKLVASASRNQTAIGFNLENHEAYRIRATSFDANGLEGCKSGFIDIITSINNDHFLQKGDAISKLAVFPNPAKTNVNIKYLVIDDSNVSIKIVDIFGKEIAMITDNFHNRGVYELNYSTDNLPSAMYYVVLQIGSYSETRKLQIVK